MNTYEEKLRTLFVELAELLRIGCPPEAMEHLDAIVRLSRESGGLNNHPIDGVGHLEVPLDLALSLMEQR